MNVFLLKTAVEYVTNRKIKNGKGCEVKVFKRSIANFTERLVFCFYEAGNYQDKIKKRGKYPIPDSGSKYIQRR